MKDKGVGISDYTASKQDFFRKLIHMQLGIVKGIVGRGKWADKCFYYFDLNAGPGIYATEEREIIIGSPVIFLQECLRVKVEYKAHLIEKNPANAGLLRKYVDPYMSQGDITVYEGDHNFFLPVELPGRGSKMGLLYTDPSGSLPPFYLLRNLSVLSTYRKIDFLISLSATAMKRARKSPKTHIEFDLREGIKGIEGKSFWLIREPETQQQWTFIL